MRSSASRGRPACKAGWRCSVGNRCKPRPAVVHVGRVVGRVTLGQAVQAVLAEEPLVVEVADQPGLRFRVNPLPKS